MNCETLGWFLDLPISDEDKLNILREAIKTRKGNVIEERLLR